jgi:hypothetical protein
LGLLRPARIDQESGYRFYSASAYSGDVNRAFRRI